MFENRPQFARVSPERQAAAKRARTAAIAEALPGLWGILGGNGYLLTLLPLKVSIPIVIAEVLSFADGLSNTYRRDKLLNPSVPDNKVRVYRTPIHEFIHKKILRRG